ncbi:MAG: hypothetical protein FWG37_02160 [Clostridia bacterium]|nr:hypothetical protein [Clostridia bacterium]
MKRILAVLVLSCLLGCMFAPAAFADSVRITSAVTGGRTSRLADSVKPASATVEAGKPFKLTFTYKYEGPTMYDLTLLFAVDCSQAISVSVWDDFTYGYLRAQQITPKSHDVYAVTAIDEVEDVPATVPPTYHKEVREHGDITVTVSGTAPAKGSFVVSFTPRGRSSVPITIAVEPARK